LVDGGDGRGVDPRLAELGVGGDGILRRSGEGVSVRDHDLLAIGFGLTVADLATTCAPYLTMSKG